MPYRLPGDTNAKLVQLEILMHWYFHCNHQSCRVESEAIFCLSFLYFSVLSLSFNELSSCSFADLEMSDWELPLGVYMVYEDSFCLFLCVYHCFWNDCSDQFLKPVLCCHYVFQRLGHYFMTAYCLIMVDCKRCVLCAVVLTTLLSLISLLWCVW